MADTRSPRSGLVYANGSKAGKVSQVPGRTQYDNRVSSCVRYWSSLCFSFSKSTHSSQALVKLLRFPRSLIARDGLVGQKPPRTYDRHPSTKKNRYWTFLHVKQTTHQKTTPSFYVMPGGIHPPLEVKLSWPKPNFENPTLRPDTVLWLSCILGPLTVGLLLVRLWVRIFHQRSPGWDDWLMLAATVRLIRSALWIHTNRHRSPPLL
jgi:hypothetical protein